MTIEFNALNSEQLAKLNDLLNELSPNQQIWLSGYLQGRLSAGGGPVELNSAASYQQKESYANLTILYGSETGNSQNLAAKLAEKARFKNINPRVFSMYEYDTSKLAEEENLALIVSTHGEGDPPDMAEDFYNFVTGDGIENLGNISYSVLALGDKTYKYFCKTGEVLDAAFKKKGAFAFAPITKCDVDYEQSAEIWMNNLLLNIAPQSKPQLENKNEVPAATEVSEYSKTNPFLATVTEKVKLSGRESDKEVYHIELSLENSGLNYEPGDSLGIFTKNPANLVDKILQKTGFDPEQKVYVGDEQISVKDALTYHFEITVINFNLLKKYQEFTKNKALKVLIENDEKLDDYLYGHDVLDLLEDFPYEWNAHKLTEILRKLPPRLYSISSSQKTVKDKVHITVSVVKYENKNRQRVGACTYFLAENIELNAKVPVYIDKNPSFKLPPNGSPIIMVGAGTGVAPYRAFLQEREENGLMGDSWLFFGDRRSKSDFLYQAEWQKYLDTEVLERMDVAFSRDQEEKIYVQHKLLDNQEEVFEWIENGAYFYLCGDMKYMAKDVNKTLLEIVQNQAGVDEEQAKRYVKELKKDKRFQSDVY